MTQLVQVALAEDIAEAEELQTILNQAGIASELEPAVEHHPRANEDTPQKVLVAEDSLEAAQHAIEAPTEPDEPVSAARAGFGPRGGCSHQAGAPAWSRSTRRTSRTSGLTSTSRASRRSIAHASRRPASSRMSYARPDSGRSGS